MNGFRISHRIIFGLIIIGIGSALLLNGLEIIDADLTFGTYWPLILILFGIVKIINFDESTFVGGIFLLLGIYFQLKNFHVEFLDRLNLGTVFWPVVVILFGLSLIFENRYQGKKVNKKNHYDDIV